MCVYNLFIFTNYQSEMKSSLFEVKSGMSFLSFNIKLVLDKNCNIC